MIEQYDLFGGCSEIKEPIKPNRKYKTMQELHGLKVGETCKSCSHLLKYRYHNNVYYKCDLWRMSHSTATDIRLKNIACGKWEGELKCRLER